MNKITAIIPTLNEEIHIKDAIKSVNFADEIIIIDSFSSDNTLAIAKEYNVKIIKRKFDDFSSQKNFAIRHAKNDWIYILDADERVTEKLANEIKATVNSNVNCVGYYVNRVFYFKNRPIYFGGWRKKKVIRLFLKSYCMYDGKMVHEKVKANGKVGKLENKVLHYSYRDLEQFKKKLKKYAKLQAKELQNKDNKVTFFHILLKPTIRFVIHYFIRFGFLDGFRGFQLAYLMGYSVHLRYIYLKDLRKRDT